ncbi:hypothetical protein LguiB_001068 [Lonicera macranthoides]
MGKLIKSSFRKKKSIVKDLFLLLSRRNSSSSSFYTNKFEPARDSGNVSNDVKEGHFAVIAVNEDEYKKFIVPLSYLNHPTFLNLLEQSAEEYGFDHGGALVVPCRPCQLERKIIKLSTVSIYSFGSVDQLKDLSVVLKQAL